MSRYKPNGVAHSALQAIDRGSVSKADVRRALGFPRAKQTKANALIENLRADGLVVRRSCGGFWLTRAGEDLLQALAYGYRAEVEYGRIQTAA